MLENIKADVNRLGSEDCCSFRMIIRGLLSQGFQALLVYRLFRWCEKKKIPTQPIRFFVERFIEITTGISIPAECEIGKGMLIRHFGGIVFHPTVKIGDNCTIYHGVTIGDNGGHGGAATIDDNVMIGAGAKVVGEIAIGNGCKIGANAVVYRDMPSDTTLVSTGMVLNHEKFGIDESLGDSLKGSVGK